jgi:hypothetical protein
VKIEGGGGVVEGDGSVEYGMQDERIGKERSRDGEVGAGKTRSEKKAWNQFMVECARCLTELIGVIAYPALCGLFVGLAISIRSSELLWVGPMVGLLWIFNLRKIGVLKTAIVASTVVIALLPTLVWNTRLYGSPLSGGYPEMNRSIASVAGSGAALAQNVAGGSLAQVKPILKSIKNTVFHFGFNPELSHATFFSYFIRMFPLLFWASLAGLVFVLLNYRGYSKKTWLFLASGAIASVVLVYYYGSWLFFDNPDKTRATIGNSYTRYWLPIYMFAILLAARFFSSVLRGKLMYAGVPAVMLFLYFFTSVSIGYVISGSEEGLKFTMLKSREARKEWHRVLGLTPKSATIVTEYHDKLLFPERKVILGNLTDANMNALYAEAARSGPVYYYNFSLSEDAVRYLNDRKLDDFGLSLVEIQKITKDFSLYSLETRNELAIDVLLVK